MRAETIEIAKPEPVVTSTEAALVLAVQRTRVAYERTMMAWIRTAISLITFGFAIYKFFDFDQHREGTRRNGPRIFGFLMVCMGLFSLLLGAIENRQQMRALHHQYAIRWRSMATILAFMIAMLGILALVVMLMRD